MDQDKRRHKRHLKMLKVSYSILCEDYATPFEFGKCITLDISRSGVKLALQDELPVPLMVQLNINTPNRDYGIFILGKVLYCHTSEMDLDQHKWEAGIKFVGLLPPDLDDYISENIENPELDSDPS